MFISGLSVSEFVLLPGLRIVGAVYASVVHTAGEAKPPKTSQVMKTATRNRSRIVATAISRLQENALRIGASAVIGVQIRHLRLEENILEYTIGGTAIAEDALAPLAKPVICTLSGQEYQLLVSSGYRPVGVAFGISIYSQKLHQRVQQQVERNMNTERSDFTRGLYTARKYAFAALHQEAATLKSEGILAVHVQMERSLHSRSGLSSSMMINMVATGTAIVSCPKHENIIRYVVPLTT